jgi:pantothenate kinase
VRGTPRGLYRRLVSDVMQAGLSNGRYCVALEHIEPYPWFLNKPLELVVNERMVRTRITASEWADSWRPFLARIYDLWIAQFPKRYLVAIAGPPGAGKSVFAEQLHFIIDKGILHRDAHTVALPMDGFHYAAAALQAHQRILPDGSQIPFSSLQGHPDTIDVPRMRRMLQALIARPEYVTWPGYSRFAHDVIPDKYRVHMSVNVVILEGNYLLLDRGPFQGLPAFFDLRIYVDAPAPKIIANLMDRHIRGGQTIDDAKDWLKRIDLPNARVVESTKGSADVVVERDTDDDIASVTWRGEEPLSSSKPGIPEVSLPPASGQQTRHPGATHLPAGTPAPGAPPQAGGTLHPGATRPPGETHHPGDTRHPGATRTPPQTPPPGPPPHP